MGSIKRVQKVSRRGTVSIKVPKDFGEWVEVNVKPYKHLSNEWTEGEWQYFSLNCFVDELDDKGVDWEEFFAIKDR
jgi:hypothetical protein